MVRGLGKQCQQEDEEKHFNQLYSKSIMSKLYYINNYNLLILMIRNTVNEVGILSLAIKTLVAFNNYYFFTISYSPLTVIVRGIMEDAKL